MSDFKTYSEKIQQVSSIQLSVPNKYLNTGRPTNIKGAYYEFVTFEMWVLNKINKSTNIG